MNKFHVIYGAIILILLYMNFNKVQEDSNFYLDSSKLDSLQASNDLLQKQLDRSIMMIDSLEMNREIIVREIQKIDTVYRNAILDTVKFSDVPKSIDSTYSQSPLFSFYPSIMPTVSLKKNDIELFVIDRAVGVDYLRSSRMVYNLEEKTKLDGVLIDTLYKAVNRFTMLTNNLREINEQLEGSAKSAISQKHFYKSVAVGGVTTSASLLLFDDSPKHYPFVAGVGTFTMYYSYPYIRMFFKKIF